MVRVRPFFKRESFKGIFLSTVEISEDKRFLNLYEYHNVELVPQAQLAAFIEDQNNFETHQFKFDRIFSQETAQEQVYQQSVRPMIPCVLAGYNATAMVYGQTGAGKTYTIEGNLEAFNESSGIMPRAIREIFELVGQCGQHESFTIKASYFQIYQENISDLLLPERSKLMIRQSKDKGFFVKGLSVWVVKKARDVLELLKNGQKNRFQAETMLNISSSRSHAIFKITIEKVSRKQQANEYQKSELNFVDLAGSERLRVTQAVGQRLEECKYINQSLSALRQVIKCLNQKKRKHIPYRNSKLSTVLANSLGGNCKTCIITCVSPAAEAFSESLSSLKFANQAKKVRNQIQINTEREEKNAVVIYQNEIQRLKSQLQQVNRNLIDRSLLIGIQEEKNKALKDKELALQKLEQTHQEFLRVHSEKQQLLSQIEILKEHIIKNQQIKDRLPTIKEEDELANESVEKENSSLRSKLKQQEQLILEQQKENEEMRLLLKQFRYEIKTYERIVNNSKLQILSLRKDNLSLKKLSKKEALQENENLTNNSQFYAR